MSAAPGDNVPLPSGVDQIAAIMAAAEEGPAAPAEGPDDDPGLQDGGFDVVEMNREYALVLMGSKAVIAREQSSGPLEDRLRLLSVDAFAQWHANTWTETRGADGKVKSTTWAARWLKHRLRRQYSGIEFFPNPDGARSTAGYLNLWRGFAVVPRPKENGWSILRDHVLTNICEGSEALFLWFFGWFAHMFQRPRERIGTAVVLRGKMGTGKTKVGEVIGSLFPAHYFAVDDPRYVTGQFNAHMGSCLLLQAEEAVWAGDKAAEGRLKGLVTSKFQMIENKGIDPIRLDNFVRLMMTSNEDWVVPAGKDERRFCVLDVNPRCAQNTDYFREMDEQLDDGGREALLHDLLTFDLSQVDLRRIPRTRALLEQKFRSLDSVESWWFERLIAGTTTAGGEYWLEEIPVYTFFDDYITQADKVGVRRKSELTAFGIKLAKVVPGLVKSRPYLDVGGVVKRTWCYRLPPLEACRDAFQAELGQAVQWPDEAQPEDAMAP